MRGQMRKNLAPRVRTRDTSFSAENGVRPCTSLQSPREVIR